MQTPVRFQHVIFRARTAHVGTTLRMDGTIFPSTPIPGNFTRNNRMVPTQQTSDRPKRLPFRQLPRDNFPILLRQLNTPHPRNPFA
jgi:hypothetical protein